jgi:phosphoenolpyruvate carboxylase
VQVLRAERRLGAEAAQGTAAADVQKWPFFSTLLSNMDMVLAKSDLSLATRYAELVPDARSCARRCSPRSRPNGTARQEALTLITGDKQRLATTEALARSIAHRFPYIDPLHHLQVELISRYRAGRPGRKGQARHPHLDQRHCRRAAGCATPATRIKPCLI